MSFAVDMDFPRKPERRLVPRPHAEPGGTPYFDEELGVPHKSSHRIMVSDVSVILAALAAELGLSFLSDEPIWYLHPETDEQRTFFGDCVLANTRDTSTITADAVLLVMEVVSTNDRRKELKDTRFQKLLNEYNRVPEFALLFPDLEDARAVTWCRFFDGVYQEHAVGPGGIVQSESVPGLELHVLPRDAWASGYKFEVFYNGVRRPRLIGERARAEAERERAEAERERAEAERERAEAERERAEAERERAERLAAKLRALGIDPDA
jgi:hypothetical protein